VQKSLAIPGQGVVISIFEQLGYRAFPAVFSSSVSRACVVDHAQQPLIDQDQCIASLWQVNFN
jgi:hypothetical protein